MDFVMVIGSLIYACFYIFISGLGFYLIVEEQFKPSIIAKVVEVMLIAYLFHSIIK